MNSTETKIRAMFVIEVIGRPPEYLTETLNEMVKKIKEEKGVVVKNDKINPPVLMKDQKDFYTSFAEVEVETENTLYLAILMFKYMPAYIEIISPQNISLTNGDLGDVFNELTRRLHGYEEVARVLQTEKTILENKLREYLVLHPEESPIKGSEIKKEDSTEKKGKKK
jgi:hypothetical protein